MRRTIALGLNLRSFSSERPHGYHVDGFAHFLILTAVFCIFFSPETPVFSHKTPVVVAPWTSVYLRKFPFVSWSISGKGYYGLLKLALLPSLLDLSVSSLAVPSVVFSPKYLHTDTQSLITMILPWLPSSLFLFSFVSSSFSLSYGIEYRY